MAERKFCCMAVRLIFMLHKHTLKSSYQWSENCTRFTCLLKFGGCVTQSVYPIMVVIDFYGVWVDCYVGFDIDRLDWAVCWNKYTIHLTLSFLWQSLLTLLLICINPLKCTYGRSLLLLGSDNYQSTGSFTLCFYLLGACIRSCYDFSTPHKYTLEGF